MANKLELLDSGQVAATTSFDIVDIKSCIWYDSLGEELKHENENAFYGEELKLCIELDGLEDNIELEIEILAKNGEGEIIELSEEERQPLKMAAKMVENKVTFEPFYVNPKWFHKDAINTYTVNLKIKDDENYLEQNLPLDEAYQLKPIGFGKPALFKIDKAKGYLLVKKSDGSKTAYTSGERLEIPMYQEWFENGSDELSFNNDNQIYSYFENVYLTHLFKWSIRREFKIDSNRQKIIAEFERAGVRYNIPPSILWTYAAGEGLLHNYSKAELSDKVNSFKAFGLDHFENDAHLLKSKGYLDSSFKSAGKVIIDTEKGRYIYPDPFIEEYAGIRYDNGDVQTTTEPGATKTGLSKKAQIFPVIFRDMLVAIEGACAVYANAYDYTTKSALNLGWGTLTPNQHAFYAYVKIQKTSENGNAEIDRYRKKSGSNFLEDDYTTGSNDDLLISNKCYHRWVAWRYVLLGKHFSK